MALPEGATVFDLGPGRRWELVADIESLLAGLYATLAVAAELATAVEEKVLGLSASNQTPPAELRRLPGISPEEQELFREARGRFVHNYSAWPAIVIDGENADLAILTRGTADFQTGQGYVLLSRIDAVTAALVEHNDALEVSLAERVDQLGR